MQDVVILGSIIWDHPGGTTNTTMNNSNTINNNNTDYDYDYD